MGAFIVQSESELQLIILRDKYLFADELIIVK